MLLSLGLPSHHALQHVLWSFCSQIQENHCTGEEKNQERKLIS